MGYISDSSNSEIEKINMEFKNKPIFTNIDQIIYAARNMAKEEFIERLKNTDAAGYVLVNLNKV